MSDRPRGVTSVSATDQPIRREYEIGELTDSIAPMPTAHTIRMRTFLPYQLYRFGRVNLRMLGMVRRSQTH